MYSATPLGLRVSRTRTRVLQTSRPAFKLAIERRHVGKSRLIPSTPQPCQISSCAAACTMADQELSLGDLSTLAPFHLGGNIPLSTPISLFFTKPDGTAGHLRFPNSTSTSSNPEFQALLDACKPATFGKGTTEVLDPNYRQALCLGPEDFAINTTLPSHEMLHDIHHLLQPGAQGVSAQLYKLNIYGPGGFFKSHVDTPRGEGMFGSLVVCLPTNFAGGGLVLKGPAEQQHTHEWGGAHQASVEGAPATESVLQWAAFYSDVEHEILPVTEGYRITLTYNLYSIPKAAANNTTDSIAGGLLSTKELPLTSTFSQELAVKLQDDTWYPSGITLGFALDHLYAEVNGAPSVIEPHMLKGSDMLLHQTAVQLGLKTRILPVMEARNDSDDSDDGDDRDAKVLLVGNSFNEVMRPMGVVDVKPNLDWVSYDGGVTQQSFLRYVCGVSYDQTIVWVKKPTEEQWRYRVKTAAYGNEPCMRSWYVAAVMLIDVPESPRVPAVGELGSGRRRRRQ